MRNGNSKCLNAVLYNDILPMLKKANIRWRGWYAFRRGLATNLDDLGVDDITIQHVLRHSDVSITRNSYIKTLPEQTVDAMQQFEQKWEKVTTNLIQ